MVYSTAFRPLLLPLLLIFTWLALGWTAAHAQAIPPAPQVPVRGYVLMDYQSGNILAEMNSNERMEPASITKLMTGYVIYQALKSGKIHLDDQVTISEKAWRTQGSKMFIKVGSQVSVEDLLMGMVVQSGNDATVALAEHVAGSEDTFVKLMNQEAERLGMKNSHFTNTPGMPDPNHYMSARDIAVLSRAIIREFPEHYARYSVASFKYNNIEQQNRNQLMLTDRSVDGIKTGHTQSAGYCLAASAKRDETRLISVVLGAQKMRERFQATQTLLNYGFSFFESRKLHDPGTPIVTARIWKGEESELPLGVTQGVVRHRTQGSSGAGQYDHHGRTHDHRSGAKGSTVRRNCGQGGRAGSQPDTAGGVEGRAGKWLVRADDRFDPDVLLFPVQLKNRIPLSRWEKGQG